MTWDMAHPPTPEDPALLRGPEIGALVRFVYGPPGHRWHGIVVRVVARSYVWSPELRNSSGFYGYRHYEWSVIEFEPGKKMVTNDTNLFPIELGDQVVSQEAA